MSIDLLPKTYGLYSELFVPAPSKTYAIDWGSGRIRGFTDGIDAMPQAIFKYLETWVGAHDIYDGSYGFEARGLIGFDRGYVESELKRRIKEALSIDERIIEANDFSFSDGEDRNSIAVSFTCATIFGEFSSTYKVKIA